MSCRSLCKVIQALNKSSSGRARSARHCVRSGMVMSAGLATGAAKAGKSERSIMKQTGHRSVSVVRRYIRDAELFDDNAAACIGL